MLSRSADNVISTVSMFSGEAKKQRRWSVPTAEIENKIVWKIGPTSSLGISRNNHFIMSLRVAAFPWGAVEASCRQPPIRWLASVAVEENVGPLLDDAMVDFMIQGRNNYLNEHDERWSPPSPSRIIFWFLFSKKAENGFKGCVCEWLVVVWVSTFGANRGITLYFARTGHQLYPSYHLWP